MEPTFISINPTNWITITLMMIGSYLAFVVVSQMFFKGKANGG